MTSTFLKAAKKAGVKWCLIEVEAPTAAGQIPQSPAVFGASEVVSLFDPRSAILQSFAMDVVARFAGFGQVLEMELHLVPFLGFGGAGN
jgi:hypothetical protein